MLRLCIIYVESKLVEFRPLFSFLSSSISLSFVISSRPLPGIQETIFAWKLNTDGMTYVVVSSGKMNKLTEAYEVGYGLTSLRSLQVHSRIYF